MNKIINLCLFTLFCSIALVLSGCLEHDPAANRRGSASNSNRCYANGSLVNPGDWVKHNPTGNIGVVFSASSRKFVNGKWMDCISVQLHDGHKYAGLIMYKSVELVKIDKPNCIVPSDRVKVPFKPIKT